MKIFKTISLSMIFLFGLAAMSFNTDDHETNLKTDATVFIEVPCATVYTVCDRAHPDSFGDFIHCMSANGC